MHMALGAFFSATEITPLMFLTLKALSFPRVARAGNGEPRR